MYIDAIRTQLYSYMQVLRESDNVISTESIKNKYLGIADKEETILELYEENNENATKLIGIDYAADSVQRHTTTYRHIKAFLNKKYGLDDIEVKEIDYKFLSDLILYFKIDKGIGHNTTMKYLKNLKKIVRIAIARGIISRDPYINIKMKTKQKERGFLSEEDLNKIINRKFNIARLEQVRDTFLFSSVIGINIPSLDILSDNNDTKTKKNNKQSIVKQKMFQKQQAFM